MKLDFFAFFVNFLRSFVLFLRSVFEGPCCIQGSPGGGPDRFLPTCPCIEPWARNATHCVDREAHRLRAALCSGGTPQPGSRVTGAGLADCPAGGFQGGQVQP